MRQSPTHEAIHDKKTDRRGSHRSASSTPTSRTDLARLTGARSLARHAARPSVQWRFATDRIVAFRAVVAPFVATLRSGHARKVAVATGLLSCLGLAAMAQNPPTR